MARIVTSTLPLIRSDAHNIVIAADTVRCIAMQGTLLCSTNSNALHMGMQMCLQGAAVRSLRQSTATMSRQHLRGVDAHLPCGATLQGFLKHLQCMAGVAAAGKGLCKGQARSRLPQIACRQRQVGRLMWQGHFVGVAALV